MPRRSPTNQDIAKRLEEIGLYLEAEGVAFKPRAYETAAQTVRATGEELSDMIKRCGITCIDSLPGIGSSIAEKIREYVTTGKMHAHEEMKRRFPFEMWELTRIQGLGAKTALELYKKLGVKKVSDLKKAVKSGAVSKLAGFGARSQERLSENLAFSQKSEGRMLLHKAHAYAYRILMALRAVPGVTHAEVAGSLRRMQETVGDIDLVLVTSEPKEAAKAFMSLKQVEQVLEEGPRTFMVRYGNGLNGDLIILKPDEWGTALLHFTGSREHSIQLRERAIKRGLKLSEYGLFKGKRRLEAKTEEDVYRHLGLPFIAPEMRENQGEIAAAEAGTLPEPLAYDALKGDLQVQTEWTDGSNTIEEMARAAKTKGLSYIAITDHTQTLTITNGLTERRLAAQGKEIDAVNARMRGFKILKGTECDILMDGTLDLNDAALKKLDLVCVSVHSGFRMEENEMTERIIRALKHPSVNVLFHPTGRKVTRREPYAVDMLRVIRAAKEFGVALEVNGSDRLDIKDAYVREAVKIGVKLVVNSDAHGTSEYFRLPYGIATARRGWATKDDVLNTLSADKFLKAIHALKKKRGT